MALIQFLKSQNGLYEDQKISTNNSEQCHKALKPAVVKIDSKKNDSCE